MKEVLTKAVTQRQFLKMCGLAIVGAGAGVLVMPPQPASALFSITDDLYVSGKVGIGTSNPTLLLDARSDDATTYSVPVSPTPRMRIANTNTTNNNYSEFGLATVDANGTVYSGVKLDAIFTSHAANAVSADLAIATRNAGTLNEVMRLTGGGNVGIGITTPWSKLTLSTAAGLDGLSIVGANAQNVSLLTNLGQGTFNGTVQAGDRGIIYCGASVDNPGGGFVIVPWRSGFTGLRLDAFGNMNLNGEFRVNGNLAVRSDGVATAAAQAYYA